MVSFLLFSTNLKFLIIQYKFEVPDIKHTFSNNIFWDRILCRMSVQWAFEISHAQKKVSQGEIVSLTIVEIFK